MRRTPLTALGLCVLAGLASNVSHSEELTDLSFGETLYYAYQGKWFEALEHLDVEVRRRVDEPEHDALWYQMADAEFSLGDIELNYRMDHRAVLAIQSVIKESVDERISNAAAYRLARMHFRKGQDQNALRALDHMSGKVSADSRDDVASLRASVYLAMEWPEPAIPVLEDLLKSKEYGAFAAYNLGIAYLQGDLRTEAYKQLDRAGKFKNRNSADAAIRDKANLVLGTMLHEDGQYNRAVVYLNRVRLDGPFSNRALLGAGWASMSAGKPDRALVSWSTLAERDATDRATQEAMLALPYAYSQLGVHSQAVLHYGRALDAYDEQIDKLTMSINSIRAGNFLAALTRENIGDDEDWIFQLRDLPDAPETYYLMELLASNDFQTILQDYLDLTDLRRRLAAWQMSIQSYDELVANRERHYAALLPEVDEQFSDLETRLQRQFEQQQLLLKQREAMLASPTAQPQQQALLDELDRNLRSLDSALALAQEQHERYKRAYKAATDSYTGYGEPLGELPVKIRDSIDDVENLLASQGRLLESLATNELLNRRRRLEVYADKARFGLANSYDRANQEAQQ
jgi:predicted negative regulator of RcsB-dependent stress response